MTFPPRRSCYSIHHFRLTEFRICCVSPEMMAFGQTLFARPAPVLLQSIFCENILGDYVGNSINKDPTPYDIAIVDLMFNECGLALAHRLGIPAVGYWAFSFSSGWQVGGKERTPITETLNSGVHNTTCAPLLCTGLHVWPWQ